MMELYNCIYIVGFLFLCKTGYCHEEKYLTNQNGKQNNSLIIIQNSTSNVEVILEPQITWWLTYRQLPSNQTCNDPLENFPSFFTREQRKNGAVIISFLVGIYSFTFLAILCDSYFLPCVERMCEYFHLSKDVAAATFMAMATSSPELFVNVIGTFITQSDIGLGTVVGSSLFNTLGISALGGLAAASAIKVHWWPVTRDCSLYIIAIFILVLITWDGLIYWYESMCLVLTYIIYLFIMFNNNRISKFFKNYAKRRSKRSTLLNESTITNLSLQPSIFVIEDDFKQRSKIINDEKPTKRESYKCNSEFTENKSTHKADAKTEKSVTSIDIKSYQAIEENDDKDNRSLFTMPKEGLGSKILFIYTWPIKFILYFTIPNPTARPRLFPIVFILCVLFMGLNSYVISWVITVIGDTFGIPQALLGLTFLAAGSCLPEAISIIIMSKKGEGSMGISNGLGANTINVLLSLGLPWFIKNIITIQNTGTLYVEISSGAIEISILGLMIATVTLFLTMFFNRFKLGKRLGVVLLMIYLIFLTLAIVSEVIFFKTNLC